MQINKSPLLSDSWYIEHNDALVREAWLNGTRVWSYTIPITSFKEGTIPGGAWKDVAFCDDTGDLLVSGTNKLSYSNDDGATWGTPYELEGLGSPDVFNTVGCGTSGDHHTWLTVETQLSSSVPSNYKLTQSKRYYLSNAMPPAVQGDWDTYLMSFPLSAGLAFNEAIYSDYWERFIAVGSPIDENFTNTHYPITQETTDIGNSLVGLSGIIGGYLSAGTTTLNGSWLSAGLYTSTGNPYEGIATAGFNDVLEIPTFANYRILACGTGGASKFGYSDDGGATWRLAPWPNSGATNLQNGHAWSKLAYGHDGGVILPLSGRVVATNANSVETSTGGFRTKPFAYTDDGINWIGTGLNIIQKGWGPVTYKNGWFIAFPVTVQSRGWVAVSRNGIDWKTINIIPSNLQTISFTTITQTNNRFVLIAGINPNSRVALMDFYNPKTIDNNNDPYFNNVSLLLHMDGTNGSQTFTDSSSNNLTLTVNGNTQISTAITPKFGTACGYFDNLNPTGLETNSISLGLNDFTLEGWIYHIPGANDPIFNQGNFDITGAFFVTLDTGNRLVLYADNNVRFTSTATVPNSQWTYIAVTRSSGTYYFFINGVLDGTYTGSHNHTQLPFKIGDGYGGVRFWSGYMDDIRVTEGVARYTSNFTPPTQPFPNS